MVKNRKICDNVITANICQSGGEIRERAGTTTAPAKELATMAE